PSAAGYQSYRDKGISPCDINGDPVLLDQLLAGLNINNTVTGFGAVGTVVNGVFQTGAQQLRRSGAFPPGQFSTVQQYLSWGDFDNVANFLLGLAPTTAQGRQNLPAALTGVVGQTGLRNGCDRLANGFATVQQTTAGGAQVANTGAGIPLRCFPEDWLH